MALTHSSGPELFLQLQENCHDSPAFSMRHLFVHAEAVQLTHSCLSRGFALNIDVYLMYSCEMGQPRVHLDNQEPRVLLYFEYCALGIGIIIVNIVTFLIASCENSSVCHFLIFF